MVRQESAKLQSRVRFPLRPLDILNLEINIRGSQPAGPVVAFGVTPQNAVAEGEAPPNGGPREAACPPLEEPPPGWDSRSGLLSF